MKDSQFRIMIGMIALIASAFVDGIDKRALIIIGAIWILGDIFFSGEESK